MKTHLTGTCHCGNLSYEITSEIIESDILARACDCSFCRIHAAKNWSDPDGIATLRILDINKLQKYRFGLKTADFYICKECGAYLGAILTDADESWSTLNLRLSKITVAEQVANYSSENKSERIERRKRVWTPTIFTSV